jgi:hypothetical protein
MADVKHTPGPWRYVRANPSPTTGEHLIAGAKPGYLAEVRDCGSGSVAANARLISAAPDLLESLRAFVSPWDGDSVEEIESQSGLATSVRIEQARAAIAKATGAARATEGSATDAAECTCAAKDMPFGRCCKAGAA